MRFALSYSCYYFAIFCLTHGLGGNIFLECAHPSFFFLGLPLMSCDTTSMVPGGSSNPAIAAGKFPFPQLTRTNYATWAMRMKYLLRAHGAWGVVDRESSSKEVDESKEELAMTICG